MLVRASSLVTTPDPMVLPSLDLRKLAGPSAVAQRCRELRLRLRQYLPNESLGSSRNARAGPGDVVSTAWDDHQLRSYAGGS